MLLYENETGQILHACFNVHKELGHGFLEAVYQEALATEFETLKIPYEREKKLPVVYKGKRLNKEYYADFVCFDKIIVELKAVSILNASHKAQVIKYLSATNNTIGLLINFGTCSLEWKRISCFKKGKSLDFPNPCANNPCANNPCANNPCD